ncbi:MAG: CheR family methyltransferase [Polyangiaceae bacterium]|jgi:chemotaxis protein methyltransferase CheR
MNVPEITDEQFEWLRGCVRNATGIHLSDSKRQLLVSRLAPRLRYHGFQSFADYIWFLAGDRGATELREFVNSVTTNKTSFFREPHHFELLADRVVARIAELSRRGGPRRVRIWSAGCSTGEEVYSAAMVVRGALTGIAWDIRFIATDIDTDVLEEASAGIYDEDRVRDIPGALRERWLERNADGSYRVCAEIRDFVEFRQLNFIVQPWPLRGPFDAIFCRNVAIYFDAQTQHGLYRGLAERLIPGGYLFIGHSETARDLGDLIEPAGPTAYRRRMPGLHHPTLPSASTRPPASIRVASSPRSVATRYSAIQRPVMSSAPASFAPLRLSKRAASLGPPNPSRRPNSRLTRRSSLRSASTSLPSSASGPRASLAPSRSVQRRLSVTSRTSLRSPGRSQGDHVIHAGGVFVSKDGVRVRTLVGSCIAVCMFDPIAGVGGMNHFMLPHGDREGNPARFGFAAMELLIEGLLQNGAQRDRLRAKVFGASHVLAGNYQDISAINIAFIREYMEAAELPILAEKLGQNGALQIVFETDTGRAFVRELPPADASMIVGEDLRYVRQMSGGPPRTSKGEASS